jgi:hypothetical protein
MVLEEARAPAAWLLGLDNDLISFTGGPSVTIKGHHNVGGLPARTSMKLVEPLRELFKDEMPAPQRSPASQSKSRHTCNSTLRRRVTRYGSRSNEGQWASRATAGCPKGE